MITENELSDEQKIFNIIFKWTQDKHDKMLRFGGVAGSGKSTILSILAKKLGPNIAFACYTGKAANVLRQKLDAENIEYSYCGTIHGLMYIPIIDKKSLRVTGWMRRPVIDEELIIIDEASMVSERIFRDLLTYNKKILCAGDHCQLPPVKSFLNLMEKPDLMLNEIHRQAAGNPIIQLSAMIRRGEDISNFKSKDQRVKILNKNSDELDEIIYDMYKDKDKRLDSVMLCYFNSSRVRYNMILRTALGYGEEPVKDDVVICLKNTQLGMDKAIFNGMRGLVSGCWSYNEHTYDAEINFPDDNIQISELLCKYQFNHDKTFESPMDVGKFGFEAKSWDKMGLLMDYGYALTYHKSQGSSYKDVVVFVERSAYQSNDNFKRAIYTAVTRSSNNLVLAF